MKIINVMAASIDGRIGLHECEGDAARQLEGLSGSADQKLLRMEIESADAIIVGASSIRANSECLLHPGRNGLYPVWYIFATNPIPIHFNFWQQDQIPRVIISPKSLPIPVGSLVINLVYEKEDPVLFLKRHLQEKGHSICLLFGGGKINSWFYAQGAVDELHLTLAPLIIGQASAPNLVIPVLKNSIKFCLLTSHCEENFVFLKYQVIKT